MKIQAELLIAGMAVAGGITRMLGEYVRADNYKFRPRKVLANMLISMSSGMTVAFLASDMNPTAVLGMASAGGYAGVEVFDYILHKLKCRNGSKK